MEGIYSDPSYTGKGRYQYSPFLHSFAVMNGTPKGLINLHPTFPDSSHPQNPAPQTRSKAALGGKEKVHSPEKRFGVHKAV